MGVCGILSFIRDPKSFDVWFPTCMNAFALVPWPIFERLRHLASELLLGLFALDGPPYGIFLTVLNVRHIKRREFSLSILVYHLGSWLGWTTYWLLGLVAAGMATEDFLWGEGLPAVPLMSVSVSFM